MDEEASSFGINLDDDPKAALTDPLDTVDRGEEPRSPHHRNQSSRASSRSPQSNRNGQEPSNSRLFDDYDRILTPGLLDVVEGSERNNPLYQMRMNEGEIGADWDKSLDKQAHIDENRGPLLDWDQFKWKSHTSLVFKEACNWYAYKTALLSSLQKIGYKPGMTLTPLDQSKIHSVIHGLVTMEAIAITKGLGEDTIASKLLEGSFCHIGEIQQENYFTSLMTMKYDGRCPLNYVSRFKMAVQNYTCSGDKFTEILQKTAFKASVREKAATWLGLLSTIARFREWTVDDLYADFILHLYNRIELSEEISRANYENIYIYRRRVIKFSAYAY